MIRRWGTPAHGSNGGGTLSPPVLRFAFLTRIGPAELLCLADWSIEQASQGTALLLIGQPEGEAIVLGRYQRADSALRSDRIDLCMIERRRSGGKGVVLRGGTVYVGLALPARDYLLQNFFPPDRTVNRYVRPLLGALRSRGVSASYYGTDYLIANNTRIGYISFDIDRRGVVLMEAIVGWSRPCFIPEDWRRYPPAAIEPPVGTRSLEELSGEIGRPEEIGPALVREFTQRYGADLSPLEAFPPLGVKREAVSLRAPERGRSALHETAIGFVEADAEVAHGRLNRVVLYGDFIANSPAVEDLQGNLVGCLPLREPVQRQVDQIFVNSENMMIGLRPLSLITDVVLEAASSHRD